MGPSRNQAIAQAAAFVACALLVGVVGSGRFSFYRCILKSSEHARVLQDIRIAEEAHRAEVGTYAGCTDSGLRADSGDLASSPLFPRAEREIDTRTIPFRDESSAVGRCFRDLGVRADGPVRFSYAVAARGGASPYYEARAVGDIDGDGDRVEYRITSAGMAIDVVDDDD